MIKNSQIENTRSHMIEMEYITDMLSKDVSSAAPPVHGVVIENVDYKEAYKDADIDCIVFNITGLNIAIPCLNIQQVLNQQKLLSTDSGITQTGMLVGKTSHNGNIINVIDLEYLVMNGVNSREPATRYDNETVDMVLLKGCSLGILYNDKIDSQSISKNDVCWRNAESELIWIAGTITQMGLSLLDIEGLIKLINKQG